MWSTPHAPIDKDVPRGLRAQALPGLRRACLLLLCGGVGASCNGARTPSAQLDAPLPLQAVAKKPISGSETHRYQARLSAGRFLRLSIQPRRTDLRAALLAPDGRELAAFPIRENESASLAFVAPPRTGDALLQLSSPEKPPAAGEYDLVILEERPASPDDERLRRADLAVLAAEALRAENDATASKTALQKYDEALQVWRAHGKKHDEALALKNKASLEILLGRPNDALASCQAALDRCDAGADPLLRSEILSLQVYAQAHLGLLPQSLEAAYRTLDLGLETQDPRAEARALNALYEAYYSAGMRWRALTCSRLALNLWESAQDRRGMAKTQIDIGYLYDDLGDSKQAGEFYARAEALSTSLGDPIGRALALMARGGMHFNLGEYQTSMNLYREVLPIFQRAGHRAYEAEAILNLGATYYRYADSRNALTHFEQARAIHHEIGYPATEAGTWSVIGDVHFLEKRPEEALRYYRQALALSRSIRDRKYESNALRKIGQVYSVQGKRAAALLQFTEALRLHRENGEPMGEAQALSEMGRLYAEMKQPMAARARFAQALAIYRAIGNSPGERAALFQLAGMEQSLGLLAQAQAHIEKAQEVAEALRASVASQQLRTTYFASIQQQFEFQIDLLLRRHARQPRAGFDAEAFRISEAKRSRSLLEMLVEARQNLRQGADATQIAEEQQIRKQIETLVDQRKGLIAAQAPVSEIDALSARIQERINEREQVEARMRSQNPRYAELSQIKPAVVSDIQPRLDDETLLLEFSLGEAQSHLWAVSANGVTYHSLPGRAEIERDADDVFRRLSTAPQMLSISVAEWEAAYWPAARALSEKILGPVREQLGRRRLLLVLDGALARIPFSALPSPQGNRQAPLPPRPLMLDHEIIRQPSASTLLLLRRHHPAPTLRLANANEIVVFADPVFDRFDERFETPALNSRAQADLGAQQRQAGDLRRLPSTFREAQAIQEACLPGRPRVVTGFDATRTAATAPDLKAFSILHFATHGQLDNETPELSSLVFSLYDKAGRPQNGNLRLSDIYSLDLNADLVVLSACQTASGKEIKGEGVIGLSRGFLYAGSSRVLASLWSVEDLATARLMKDFYWNLLKRGERPAAALQHAQMALWQTNATHPPYFWAAFVLQGEFQ